jgi:hypothetical protein
MASGGDLDVLGDLRMTGRRSVMGPVQPHDLGQPMRLGPARIRPIS